jgi:predicted ATPase
MEVRTAVKRQLRRVLAASSLRIKKRARLGDNAVVLGLADLKVYAPENTTLRNPPPESAIQPLGTKGEGLIKLLQSFADPKFSDRLQAMKDSLQLFSWFDDFRAPDESAAAQARLQICDRWLAPDRAFFDQRSANEGFLYLLFYFALLMSWRTPPFFAIDNVDASLNPKLCSTLMTQIAGLSKKYEKQVICTTHNPAILDGLNLKDDEQRLYAVGRDSEGHTTVRRVRAPQPQPGEVPVRLSEAFMRGLIGGLPDNF